MSGVDDGLGIFKNMSGVERKIKELLELFKNNGLSITVKSNLKTANFLDMHFDLVKKFTNRIKNPMMTLSALTKDQAIHHQYCRKFQNQSQKEFQKFYQMNIFLTNQFLITKMR